MFKTPVSLMALLLFSVANIAQGQVTAEGRDARNLLEIVQSTPDLSHFAWAVERTEQRDLLRGDEPLTVFAPRNDAFDALSYWTIIRIIRDVPRLTNILHHHVVRQELVAGQTSGEEIAQAIQGDTLRLALESGEIQVNGIQVVRSISASNGVIHVVGEILFPPDE